MTKFKIALTVIFSVCIVGALLVFALSKSSEKNIKANLSVWGVISPDAFNAMYKSSSAGSNKQITVQYVQKQPSAFESDLVEALADGKGPDIIIVREDLIYKNRNKLLLVPYKSYSQRTYKDSFAEAAELFLLPEGIIAFPLAVDPLVMYWNRDIFTDNLVAEPPKYWDEFYTLVPKMTKRDGTGSVLRGTISFGEWRNVAYAKEILSMLLMQAGSPIVAYDSLGKPASFLTYVPDGASMSAGESAVNFYTQFSNPTSVNYSWNRSLPSSLNFFLGGTLATYFGFSSEISAIQQKNPNLNFDVTYVPQIRNGDKKINFGHVYAASIIKQSSQAAASFVLITSLTEPAASQALESVIHLPPVRRALLSERQTDAYRSVFYNSALLSKAWLDPDTVATNNFFRSMIESITSGLSRPSAAVQKADQDLSALLQR